MINYKNQDSLIKEFMKNPIIYLTLTIFSVNIAFNVFDPDSIIMKKILFFLSDNFYIEYIVKVIRVLIYCLTLIIYFIYVVFF